MKFYKKLSLLCGLGLLFVGCSSNMADEQKDSSTQAADTKKAKVNVQPTKGNEVKGVVTFTVVPEGVLVIADIEGLKPGEHGFHVHEHGDCSAPDGSSAGDHFNPTHQKHGGPDSSERHAGDLGNIVADSNGKAHYERVDKLIKLSGQDSIVGKSIVIHADPDDFKTQPSGKSGARIACGVIEATE